MTDHLARSYLFVPASRPERIDKALASGADAVIVDLEDAVPPGDKAAARDKLAAWLEQAAQPVAVRVNAADTAWFEDDLRVCRHPKVQALVLPKAARPAELQRCNSALPQARLLPLIETAEGFDGMRSVAAVAGVERLVFGTVDFQLDLGIDGEGEELLYFRSAMVLASRLAGLAAPVDGVSTATADAALVGGEARRARRLGFAAKLCIHPSQVAAVNAAFSPSAEEIAWAHRVLQAAEASGGAAVTVDHKMVDKPVILRAQALLARVRGAA